VCNDFGNNVPHSAYLEAFSQIRAPVVFPKAAPNLEPRDDIWPTETAPIFRRREEGVELVKLRWGFPPARPKGPPVINFRSEGKRFPKGRCLIPASHFFEFTGTKSPKSKWKFTKAGEGWFCFAGLWRPMPDGAADALGGRAGQTVEGSGRAQTHYAAVVARGRLRGYRIIGGDRSGDIGASLQRASHSNVRLNSN
jgi:putative SOS response-associated peptidase YedK